MHNAINVSTHCLSLYAARAVLACPTGWSKVDGDCYAVSESTGSFFDAFMACSVMGGDLVYTEGGMIDEAVISL